jgi:hypothetical protein
MKIRDALVVRATICKDRNQPNGSLGFIALRNNGGGRVFASSRSTGQMEPARPFGWSVLTRPRSPFPTTMVLALIRTGRRAQREAF